MVSVNWSDLTDGTNREEVRFSISAASSILRTAGIHFTSITAAQHREVGDELINFKGKVWLYYKDLVESSPYLEEEYKEATAKRLLYRYGINYGEYHAEHDTNDDEWIITLK